MQYNEILYDKLNDNYNTNFLKKNNYLYKKKTLRKKPLDNIHSFRLRIMFFYLLYKKHNIRMLFLQPRRLFYGVN